MRSSWTTDDDWYWSSDCSCWWRTRWGREGKGRELWALLLMELLVFYCQVSWNFFRFLGWQFSIIIVEQQEMILQFNLSELVGGGDPVSNAKLFNMGLRLTIFFSESSFSLERIIYFLFRSFGPTCHWATISTAPLKLVAIVVTPYVAVGAVDGGLLLL